MDQKDDGTGDENENEDVDIEEQIKREVEQMQPKRSKAPFQLINLDVPCRKLSRVRIIFALR